MITLSKKLRDNKKNSATNVAGQAASNKRTFVRDRLLVKGTMLGLILISLLADQSFSGKDVTEMCADYFLVQ